MEHRLNNIKSDFYKVFVEGNANGNQITRVFLIITLPLVVICLFTLR